MANNITTADDKKGGNVLKKTQAFLVKRGKSIARSFRDTYAELRKVTWPSRQDLINQSLVVLAFMGTFIIIIGALDAASAWLVSVITSR